jgi:hypothetical protein
MYRFHRQATLKNGADIQRAIAYSVEITAHLNANLDLNLQFGLEMFNESRIHWSADFASLAEYEEKFGRLMGDTAYFAMLEGGRDLWVDGSLQDSIYKVIG